MRLTMKFGGTSVGAPQRIRDVAGLVAASVRDGNQVAVVVSAMSGVTDSLIKAARTAADGDASTYRVIRDDLLVRHWQVVNEVAAPAERTALHEEIRAALDNLENLCRAMNVLGEVTPRAMDLDILLFGDVVQDVPGLVLPRPDLLRRSYMLKPMVDIAPQVMHPVLHRTMRELWEAFDAAGHEMTQIDL